MLINQSNVKKYALEMAKLRAHKFNRVSKSFLLDMDNQLRTHVKLAVQQLPSVGKTIK